MFDKVFISYAKEDYVFAEKLYDFLIENNFKPWLDKKIYFLVNNGILKLKRDYEMLIT